MVHLRLPDAKLPRRRKGLQPEIQLVPEHQHQEALGEDRGDPDLRQRSQLPKEPYQAVHHAADERRSAEGPAAQDHLGLPV